jgi:hypothetical protein
MSRPTVWIWIVIVIYYIHKSLYMILDKSKLLSSVIINFLMEDCKMVAFNQVAHKPLSWFHYVDDIFIIWPYRSEKLQASLTT